MADFILKNENYNSRRPLTAPLSIANLKTVMSAFEADTSIGLTKKVLKSVSFKAVVNYFNEDGDKAGSATMYTENIDGYDAAIQILEENITVLQKMTGSESGAEGAINDTKTVWAITYDCAIGKDTFQVVFGRDSMKVNNYSADTTLYKLETWADSQALLA